MIELLISNDFRILEIISCGNDSLLIEEDEIMLPHFFSADDISFLHEVVQSTVAGQGFGVLNFKSRTQSDTHFQLSFFPESQSFLLKSGTGQEFVLCDNPIDRQYQIIFEHAIMGIYQSTPGGRHVVVNAALATIYGYNSPRELIHEVQDIGSQLFFSPERRLEFLKRLEEEGQCLHFESKIRRKDGKCAWISENARAIQDAHGNIKYIIGTVMDITPQKELEMCLRDARDEWQDTFDSIDELIILLDPELKIQRMNAAAKKFLSFALEFGKGDEFSCFSILHCHDIFCAECPVKKTQSDFKSHQTEFEEHSSGRFFQVRTLPRTDNSGNISGIIYVGRDITEEKRLQKESDLRLQQLILNDKLKSLGEMAAGIAHEINNPLSTIMYNYELLRDSIEYMTPFFPDAEAGSPLSATISDTRDSLLSVRRAADRIKEIIDSVKDFTRGDSASKMEKIDLEKVVQRGMEMMRVHIRKNFKNVRINISTAHVYGYFHKLEQVFFNLITNSMSAVKEIQRDASIKIYFAETSGDSTALIVEDNGSGIAPHQLKRITEPFFSTWRERGGTGLGLSIVMEIIKQHGGAIQILSRENLGSRILIHLRKNLQNAIRIEPLYVYSGTLPESRLPEGSVKISGDFDSIDAFLKENPQVYAIFIFPKGIDCERDLPRLLQEHPLVTVIAHNDFNLDFDKKDNLISYQEYIEKPELLNRRNILWQF